MVALGVLAALAAGNRWALVGARDDFAVLRERLADFGLDPADATLVEGGYEAGLVGATIHGRFDLGDGPPGSYRLRARRTFAFQRWQVREARWVTPTETVAEAAR